LKWSFTTGDYVFSSPAIGTDGMIYIGSSDNKLYALNPDGSERWNFTTGGLIHSSPAIGSDGTIYVGSKDSNIYAINPDGSEKWNFTTGSIVDSSPAIGSDSTIYIGSHDHKFYAINPDGSEKWSFLVGDEINDCSPAISPEGTIFIGSYDCKFYAINPDGSEKWRFTTGGEGSSPTIGPDGTIYIGSFDNKLYALNPDGSEKWRFTTGNSIFSSPTIGSDGTIYVGSNDFNLYAINPDGSEKWSFLTDFIVESSPSIGSDGTIYVGSKDSNVYAINPDGTEKWKFKTDDGILSSPAIGTDGTIYIGSYDNKLYAIGTPQYQPPVADAGPDQTVNEGNTGKLNGSGSTAGQYFAQNVVALWHMNEGSGNVIYDETDNHHDGTIVGANWTTNGRFGNALSFDGLDDYVKVKPMDKMFGDNPDGWTYFVWFRTNNNMYNMTIMSDYSAGYPGWKYDHTHAIDLRLYIEKPPNVKMIKSTIGYVNMGSGSARDFNYPDDNWHFVAVTISKTEDEWKFHLDGVKPPAWTNVGGTTYDYFDNDLFYIGGQWQLDPPGIPGTGGLILPFQGILDEIVLFDRALTAQEIIDYYNSGKEFLLGYNGKSAEIVSYEWDFESDGIYDYQETPSNPPDGAFDGITNHVYGDDGIFKATLRVTNNQNLTDTDTCNITVLNVDPKVTMESAVMDVEIGLRVAGRKYNNVSMTLFEEGTSIGYVSIERLPGSPNEQMAWIPVSINFSRSYSATVTYTPKDPPNVGANPVWIYIKSEDGSVNKIHHTFNVQQSKKRDSDHWNHVEPWEVDLNAHFIGLPFEITSHIIDPGSDDETLTFTYGSQVVTVTYLNNPPNPDPYPSPEVKPVDIIDTTTLVYEGAGTVTLVVKDDDNIRLGIGEGIDYLSLG